MTPLYYISQGATPTDHLNNIQHVCEGGLRLIQLRMKGVTDQVCLETATQARSICAKYDAILIINDHVEIAQQLGLGVHLGQGDTPISEAKKKLTQLIGGTANTFEECLDLIQQGVDYIGLGPFRYTHTKKNLSPLLGLEGYRQIIERLEPYPKVPIYAIGGIKETDFEDLMQTGVYGIAASSLLSGVDLDEVRRLVDFF